MTENASNAFQKTEIIIILGVNSCVQLVLLLKRLLSLISNPILEGTRLQEDNKCIAY